MSFPLGMERKFVAPFWADVDTTSAGEVWYRQSTDLDLLARATTQINNAFPLVRPQFSAVHLFIVTWDRVGYFDNKMDKVTIIYFKFIYSINILIYGIYRLCDSLCVETVVNNKTELSMYRNTYY